MKWFDSPKLLFLVGLMIAGLVVIAFRLNQKQSTRSIIPIPLFNRNSGSVDNYQAEETDCVSGKTGAAMGLTTAREIALAGECGQAGELTGEAICNQITGTWWLDLDLNKPGCAPACVVKVETKEAVINWRCTGISEPEGEEHPGQDQHYSDEYLEWARENCPEFKVN